MIFFWLGAMLGGGYERQTVRAIKMTAAEDRPIK
jgi:hypothetical protein